MKVNPQTDELLSAFIDGELSPRQQTEVQRMAAHDPDMARRLQQLRSGRTLINVLPRAEAPADLVEQIKQSLERRSLLDEHSVLSSSRAGVRMLKLRRFLAAAAMIALVGVLGVVVYQIVSPVPSNQPSFRVAGSEATPVPAPVVHVAAAAPFRGRLELSTASLSQAASLIASDASDNGLNTEIDRDASGTRIVCRISGAPERIDGLLAALSAAGQNFKNARLLVETDRFADPVIIDSVTFPQVAGILNQNTEEARMQLAKNTAVLNRFAREMPGRDVQVATSRKLDNTVSELSAIPQPRLAQGRKNSDVTAPLKEETQVKASLTIVLLNAQ